MHRFIVYSVFIFSPFLLAFCAQAQVPELINHQGRLVDGSTPVNGNVEMVLRLYDDANAGALLYEDSNTIAVVDGLYSTFLGDDTVSGSLPDALTNTEIYLEVQVDGAVLMPRERVGAVSYSLMAGGVADDAIGSGQIADGAILASDLANDAVISEKIKDQSVR
jgi:hypothetical protein